MTAEKWVPLSVREGGATARQTYEALVDEPSPGLLRGMSDYVASALLAENNSYRIALRRWTALMVEQALDVDLHGGATESNPLGGYGKLSLVQKLSVIDFCLFHFTRSAEETRAMAGLAAAMTRARFVYAVDIRARCLVRVLPGGVEAVVREAFGVRAAESQMREAVHWATGLKPDPTKSFDAMIRALEAVVKPALLPGDQGFTLGRAIGQLRAKANAPPQITLVSKLPRNAQVSPQALPTAEVVRGMLELVLAGYERHGGGGAPPTVDEARALLGVAGSLVVWFGTGVVTKA